MNIDLKKHKNMKFLILGRGRICEGGRIPARLRYFKKNRVDLFSLCASTSF